MVSNEGKMEKSFLNFKVRMYFSNYTTPLSSNAPLLSLGRKPRLEPI
jgi:hypothetical protein